MSESQTRSVGLAEVDALRRAGVVKSGQFLDAVYFCREPDFWTRWALRALLALGAAHLLAGVIFFFAYNWDSLSTMTKLAIPQAGLVACAILALIVNIDRPAGQALLIGATVFAGVLLAVIGQVYQTGADVYSLFATWALVAVPWVLVSRSAAHWLVWLIVVYVAINLYAFQVLIPREVMTTALFGSMLSVGTALLLLAREVALIADMKWLAPRWTRAVPILTALFIVFWPAVSYALGWGGELVAMLTFVILLAGLTLFYSKIYSDFSAIALCAGFAALFLMAVGARALRETIGFDEGALFTMILSLLLLVLWCAALTTGTVKLLAHARKSMLDGDADA